MQSNDVSALMTTLISATKDAMPEPQTKEEAIDYAACDVLMGNLRQVMQMSEQLDVIKEQAEAVQKVTPHLEEAPDAKSEIARKVVNLIDDVKDVIEDWGQTTAGEITEIITDAEI